MQDIITDGQARRIAAEWYSPGAPGLVALATSGAILEETLRDTEREIDWLLANGTPGQAYTEQSLCDLRALKAYVIHAVGAEGTRPRQEGWQNEWSDRVVLFA